MKTVNFSSIDIDSGSPYQNGIRNGSQRPRIPSIFMKRDVPVRRVFHRLNKFALNKLLITILYFCSR